MKSRDLILLLLVTFLIGLTSCETLFYKMYGLQQPKEVSEKTILKSSKKFHIPLADSYELDTSFISFIVSIDTAKYRAQRKNHNQPLQALYYDKSGQLQSFHINCYAGGFPNLKWDRDSILKTFPPRQQTPIDNLLPLDKQLLYLKPLSTSDKLSTDDYDYIVVVYWNKFMGRQSKRLIRFVQENCALATDKRVKIIYANNDNLYTDME